MCTHIHASLAFLDPAIRMPGVATIRSRRRPQNPACGCGGQRGPQPQPDLICVSEGSDSGAPSLRPETVKADGMMGSRRPPGGPLASTLTVPPELAEQLSSCESMQAALPLPLGPLLKVN